MEREKVEQKKAIGGVGVSWWDSVMKFLNRVGLVER